MTDYVITTKQLTKKYGSVPALDKVNLHVPKGCIYGLIGDNGAGKSTLLKILAGQSFATQGEIQLLGQSEEKGLEAVRRKTGCIIEQPGFFPNMTVEQTLHYYGIQKGVPDSGKVQEMLRLTGLTDKRKSLCRNLSLGQKQRLGLGIAMIGQPQLLILDEPINGLDPSGIKEFRRLLLNLNQEKNITILISSHILSELQQLATVYGFLYKGQLLEEISEEKLKDKCADCIEIKVSEIEKFSMLLEKAFPQIEFTVLPQGRLRIYHPTEKPEAYSRLALDARICITGMDILSTSLEDYYIELKEGGKRR